MKSEVKSEMKKTVKKMPTTKASSKSVTTQKKGMSATELTLVGAGLASIAAGTYFFLGPKGKKHQQDAAAWGTKMKGDIIKKLKTARAVSKPIYHDIVDAVAEKYQSEKVAGGKEVVALAKDLKKHWDAMSKASKKDN